MPAPVDKGLDVGILRELAKSALVESLNDVGRAIENVNLANEQ